MSPWPAAADAATAEADRQLRRTLQQIARHSTGAAAEGEGAPPSGGVGLEAEHASGAGGRACQWGWRPSMPVGLEAEHASGAGGHAGQHDRVDRRLAKFAQLAHKWPGWRISCEVSSSEEDGG